MYVDILRPADPPSKESYKIFTGLRTEILAEAEQKECRASNNKDRIEFS
jgi:hypothetical protein